jgi:ATP-dependent protease ClpP protease subunit
MNKEKFLEEKLKYTSELAINFDERIIYLFAELEANLGTYLRVRFDLMKLWLHEIEDKKIHDITIDISSYGGNLDAVSGALDFYYEMSRHDILVHTRAQGVCMSAATILLAAGTGTRASYPHTKYMLHGVQVEGVEGTASQVKQTAKTISADELEFFSYYAKFSRRGQPELSEKELLRETKKWHKKYTKDSFDHYASAKEMLELKLIDSIL